MTFLLRAVAHTGGMGEQPQYGDYPTKAAYELAWYTWRAIRRDGRLTRDEMEAQLDAIRERIAAEG